MTTPPSGISGDLFTGFELFQRNLTVTTDKFGGFQGGYPIDCTIKDGQIWSGSKLANFEDDYVILLTRELRFGCGHYYLSERSEKVLNAGRVAVIGGKIAYIDNKSGHYQPNKSDLIDAKNFFEHNQLTTDYLIVYHILF